MREGAPAKKIGVEMKRYPTDYGIPSLTAALSDYINVDEIKKLARLTGSDIPSRKAPLVEHIVRYLEGDRIQTVWQSLDELQRAAVAEVVHSEGTTFHSGRFRAKYGRDPAWGSIGTSRRDEKPTALGFFFYGNGVMPADLKNRLKLFVPRPATAKVKSLDQLPAAYDRPYKYWDSKTKKTVKGVEVIPLTLRESEQPAQREMLAVLRLVDAAKVAVSDKTRKPPKTTIKAITEILEGGDFYPHEPTKHKYYDKNAGPIRAFAWSIIIQAAKLVKLSGSRLQLTKAGRIALSNPTADTIRGLWAIWMLMTKLSKWLKPFQPVERDACRFEGLHG